jgi:methylthioribose-1-phosphate isomerase
VTPARLVTGLITERGVCKAELDSVLALFPEKKKGKKTEDANKKQKL